MSTIGVIGIGNPLRRDDGIGIVLLQRLQMQQWPDSFSFLDGGAGGMQLLHMLSAFDIIVFLDAVHFGEEPGVLHVFTPEEVRSNKAQIQSLTHGFDLFHVISFAQELDEKSSHIHIIGIEPEDVSFGEGISQTLQEKLDDFIEVIATVLRSLTTQ